MKFPLRWRQGQSRDQSRGRQAEERALEYLSRRGLRGVERNYRSTRGEIDLIMEEGDTLVFIEVRYRGRGDYGGAAESVDRRKQGRIAAAAAHYLQCHPDQARRPCRFDVVALEADAEPQWIRDAFQL